MAPSIILGPDESSLEILSISGQHAQVVQITIEGAAITVQRDDLLQALHQQGLIGSDELWRQS